MVLWPSLNSHWPQAANILERGYSTTAVVLCVGVSSHFDLVNMTDYTHYVPLHQTWHTCQLLWEDEPYWVWRPKVKVIEKCGMQGDGATICIFWLILWTCAIFYFFFSICLIVTIHLHCITLFRSPMQHMHWNYHPKYFSEICLQACLNFICSVFLVMCVWILWYQVNF